MVEQLEKAADVVSEDTNVQPVVKPAVEPEVSLEQPKVEAPQIDWEQKAQKLEVDYKALQRILQNRPKEAVVEDLRGRLSNLEVMIAEIRDAQNQELDENGNPKITQVNAQKVRESIFVENKTAIGAEIVNLMSQYGLADNDPRVELAAELWIEGIKEKDVNKMSKSAKAVRNVVANMTPKEIAILQTPKTPDAKAVYEADVQKGVLDALKKLNINPDLLKVDTYQVSQGAGSIGDKDFEIGWGDGSIPWTPANQKRADKLIGKI